MATYPAQASAVLPEYPETGVHRLYRPDIDGLRALAVLAVVGFHSFPEWIGGGFVGVDVFFVVSGFLISGPVFDGLARGRFSFLAFYARRIRRIFPALIVVLAVFWGVGWFYLLPPDFRQLGKHIVGGAGFFSNFVLWGEAGYFDKTAVAKPLLHLWSLGVEEQFYIAMPMFWYLAWRSGLGLARGTLLLCIVSFALNLFLIDRHPVGVFYSPLTRIWEILFGSLLASVIAVEAATPFPRMKAVMRAIPDNVKSAVGLILVMGSVLMVHKEQAFPGWRALFPILGSALIIAAGPHAFLNRRLLANRLLVWIGLISYPLYLWHWPLLSFLGQMLPGGGSPEIRGVAVAVSLILAALTYLLIESPVRFARHGKTWKTVLVCLAMLSVAVAGAIVWVHGGFKSRFRFEPDILKLTVRDPLFHHRWAVQVRENVCHLDQDGLRFGACAERDRRPLVFLWGDSHAAALYPGLRNLQQGKSFGIAQYTLGRCPPVLGFVDEKSDGRRNCSKDNENILGIVHSLKPNIVLLHGQWESEGYAMYAPETGRFDTAGLKKTIRAIQASGVGRIVLIGPVPFWNWYLNEILFQNYRWDDPAHRMPPLRSRNVHGGLHAIDTALRGLASETGIEFISAADVFCNDQGCLTRLGDDFASLTSFDMAHLTPRASEYLFDRISGRLLPQDFPVEERGRGMERR